MASFSNSWRFGNGRNKNSTNKATSPSSGG